MNRKPIKQIFLTASLAAVLGCELINPLIEASDVNTPPTIAIISPGNEDEFPKLFIVILEATVADEEDGDLPAALIVWSSSIDGTLGNGATISTSTLSIGIHIITLEVTDSVGETVVAELRITILDQVAIKAEDVTAPPGQTISIPIFINCPNGIESFGMRLSFPNDILEFVSVSATDLTQDFVEVDGRLLSDGITLILGGYSGAAIDPADPGNLALVDFNVKADATGQGVITLFDLVDDIETAKTFDGTLTVQ